MTKDDKRCPNCKRTLSLDNFWKDRSRSCGLSIRCKRCQSEHGRQCRYKLKAKGPVIRKKPLTPQKRNTPPTDLSRWKNIAQKKVREAIVAGTLERKPCVICGEQKVHAHHDSYLEKDFLNIRWFCNRHHRTWHMLFIPEVPAHLE